MSQYGGLWLKKEQIGAKLLEMGSDSDKMSTPQLSVTIQAKIQFAVSK